MLLWMLVGLVYLTQVTIIYKGLGLVPIILTGSLGAVLWYTISRRSTNIYLDGIIYDLVILACYLTLPLAMGWISRMTTAEITGAVLTIIGILIMKLGG